MKVLVVVDMQNRFLDFIDGSLGTAEAEAVVPAVMERIRSFEGRVIATRDTPLGGLPEYRGRKTSSGDPLRERYRRMEDPQRDRCAAG